MTKKESRIPLVFLLWVAVVYLLSYIIGLNLVASSLILLFAAYFYISGKKPTRAFFLNNAFLLVCGFGASCLIIIHKLPVYLIPYSLVSMLATLLFYDIDIARFLSVACGISVAFMSPEPVKVFSFFAVVGILASYFVYKARKRSTIIKSGLAVGAAQVVMLVFFDQFRFSEPARYLMLFLNGIVSSIIVVGVLPIFEFLFKTVTNISLLELADSSHPLLQRMALEAPGTYHHSIVVGNLSDAACKEIGANGLLARIGSYYHDIGKIEKAEYFSENQQVPHSKHELLSPEMSKLIIMNHVKDGIELAKKYRLSPPLVDFIRQHHGNSLVYYFYRRAIENLEDDQEVREEGFRYTCPKPSTKETAIVLLADSVEAAMRTLKDPTPAKTEEVVRKIINNKFIDGQLDECDLTLKDLEKICACFIRVLGGIYHTRVGYPEESKREHNGKEPAKEAPHQPEGR